MSRGAPNARRFWSDRLQGEYGRFRLPDASWAQLPPVRRGTFVHRVVDPPPSATRSVPWDPSVRWDGPAAHAAFHQDGKNRALLAQLVVNHDETEDPAEASDEPPDATFSDSEEEEADEREQQPVRRQAKASTTTTSRQPPLRLPHPTVVDTDEDGKPLKTKNSDDTTTRKPCPEGSRYVQTVYRIPMYPGREERKRLKRWFIGCRWVYDRTLDGVIKWKLKPNDASLQRHLVTEDAQNPEDNGDRLLRRQWERRLEADRKKAEREEKKRPRPTEEDVASSSSSDNNKRPRTEDAVVVFDREQELRSWNARYENASTVEARLPRPTWFVNLTPARVRKQALKQAQRALKASDTKQRRAQKKEDAQARREGRSPGTIVAQFPRYRLAKGNNGKEVLILDRDGTPFKGLQVPPAGGPPTKRCWANAVFGYTERHAGRMCHREMHVRVRDRRVLLEQLATLDRKDDRRCESQLQFNHRTGRFHLLFTIRDTIPLLTGVQYDPEKVRVVALDPGIRAFQTFYDGTGRHGELWDHSLDPREQVVPKPEREAVRDRLAAGLSAEARAYLRTSRHLARQCHAVRLAGDESTVDACRAQLRARHRRSLPVDVRGELNRLRKAQRRCRSPALARPDVGVAGVRTRMERIDTLRKRLDRVREWGTHQPGRGWRGLERRHWRMNERLTNHVRSAHGAVIRWLLHEYDVVLSPKLSTAWMHREKNLSASTKRLASAYSHASFQRRLEAAAERFRPDSRDLRRPVERRVVWSTHEAGTSGTCGRCGAWRVGLGGASVFACRQPACGLQIGRDVNGARNNFLQAYTALRGFPPESRWV